MQKNGSFATITIRTTDARHVEPTCQSCKTKIALSPSPTCAFLYSGQSNQWLYYCGRCIDRSEQLKSSLKSANNCYFFNPHEQEIVFDWQSRQFRIEPKAVARSLSSTHVSKEAGSKDTIETAETASAATAGLPEINTAIKDLDGLIGLEDIKERIQKWTKRIKGQRKLEQTKKMKLEMPMMHCFFVGPPGTGKTVTARLLKDILYESKIIKKNLFVEVDAGGLIAEYVGHTAQKVTKVVESALGGVLFIDEAYSFYNRNSHNAKFATEAVDTLIKMMEDHRQELVVIFAGYDGDMEKLFELNQGFQSRVPHHFEFSNYTPLEIKRIVEKMLKERGYRIHDTLSSEIEAAVAAVAKNGVVEGNGRWARTFAERIVEEHLIRIADSDPADITQLDAEDIRRARATSRMLRTQTGLSEMQKEAFRKLDDLIGLQTVKTKLRQMMNYFAVMQRKLDIGIPVEKPMMHMFFVGNPGTSKTTVARIAGELFRSTGLLSKGHLIEADKSDFLSATGTSLKTQEVLNKARGGILFLDEANLLIRDPLIGREVFDSILKAMEQHSDDLVVILAGQPEEMAELLKLNPALRTHAPHAFFFDDYSAAEMLEITLKILTEQRLFPNTTAQQALQSLIDKQFERNGHIADNGRWAQNLAEKIHIAQANRIAERNDSDLFTLLPADIYKAGFDTNGRA